MKMYGYMDMIWLQCKDVEMGSYGVCIWVYSVQMYGQMDMIWLQCMDVQIGSYGVCIWVSMQVDVWMCMNV